jgi:hypothetical protein
MLYQAVAKQFRRRLWCRARNFTRRFKLGSALQNSVIG